MGTYGIGHNRDRRRYDDLELDTLTDTEAQVFASGRWLRGTRVNNETARPTRSGLVSARPFTDVLRAVLNEGVTLTQVERATGVGRVTLCQLRDGKASLQIATAEKLKAMATLLPSNEEGE